MDLSKILPCNCKYGDEETTYADMTLTGRVFRIMCTGCGDDQDDNHAGEVVEEWNKRKSCPDTFSIKVEYKSGEFKGHELTFVEIPLDRLDNAAAIKTQRNCVGLSCSACPFDSFLYDDLLSCRERIGSFCDMMFSTFEIVEGAQ